MAIAEVLLTDTFDVWRQKDNQMIDAVNALSQTGDLLSVSSLSPGQTLIWDGDFFVNATVHGDGTLASDGTLTITGGPGSSRGRIYFAGNIRGLY